ncbi:hypothetical protein [Persicitalea sp.]|uniref:hypothetical protein n=1 Tax=Persicitalea sp. TaxID=3100273 RepID=UPI003594225D
MNEEPYEYGKRNGRLTYNFCVDVFAQGYDHLSQVIRIAFTDRLVGEKSATHYLIDQRYGVVFFSVQPWETLDDAWSPDGLKVSGATKFSEPIGSREASDFAWNWLQEVEYPSTEEHDGEAMKGWRVYNQEEGIVGNCRQAVVAVQPFWVYLGK